MTTNRNGKKKTSNKRDRVLHLSVTPDILRQIQEQAGKERRTLHGHALMLIEEALAARTRSTNV